MLAKLLSLFRTPSVQRTPAARLEPIMLSAATGPEHHAIAHGRGLWGERTFPKSGWTCVGIQDLGEPNRLCEACGSARVRYVHFLRHPSVNRELATGCVCAGVLLGDEEGTRARDTQMRSRAAKRARWLSRRWRRAARTGNPWLRADGHTITIYPRDQGQWGAVVSRDRDGTTRHLPRSCYTQDDAKLGAFDLISASVAADTSHGLPVTPRPRAARTPPRASAPSRPIKPTPNAGRFLEF